MIEPRAGEAVAKSGTRARNVTVSWSFMLQRGVSGELLRPKEETSYICVENELNRDSHPAAHPRRSYSLQGEMIQ